MTDNKPGVTPAYVSGDTNDDGKLDLTETWIYAASGTAVTGNYSNTGTASGKFHRQRRPQPHRHGDRRQLATSAPTRRSPSPR